MLAGNSLWDRWEQTRDAGAVSDAARRGAELARDKAQCTACHAGSSSTDATADLYHNIGVGMSNPEPDLGRYAVTEQEGLQDADATQRGRDGTVHARRQYGHVGRGARFLRPWRPA